MVVDRYRWRLIQTKGSIVEYIAYNGGITQNYLPKFGSPVLDKGNKAGVVQTLDQRGKARVFNNLIDIGSVELDILAPTV